MELTEKEAELLSVIRELDGPRIDNSKAQILSALEKKGAIRLGPKKPEGRRAYAVEA